MISVAIIDIIGLTYDGTTLSKRGLGGSESAVILIAKELAKLGLDVTVFNNCIDSEAEPGTYDNVKYVDHTMLDSPATYKFDVVISSRTVIPFLPTYLYSQFAEFAPHRYAAIKAAAKLKVVWMHDTFCRGDHLLEDMVVNKDIDELFTLSDFHTAYVTNCDHGRKRMFEVLKQHIFMTRNGAVKYIDDVNVAGKDPYLYVYNASVTKGMLPLVNDIWPKIVERIPQARLKVIGGYYRFRENAQPDEQEKTWRSMVNDPKYGNMNIEFTGVIKQSEIAEILAKASFMLFPGAFPETFGISTLESLLYNTPLITTRFGALEETAVSQACYHIDYPIEPNGLFPTVNKPDQVRKFVDAVLKANADRYLHQQKMYYCNVVQSVAGWDTVALQWKQHIYRKTGQYLSVAEYQKVSQINSAVHRIFGRRFSNAEEVYIPRNTQQRIVVITPMYNAQSYIERCISSVLTQDYSNWLMVVVDDCSTDNSFEVASRIKQEAQCKNLIVRRNSSNMGAVYNQITAIKEVCAADDIIMLLDGDDSLVNSNQVFHYFNNLYDGTTEFTYGSCWSMCDNIPLIAQPYPAEVKQSKSYRSHLFNWNMPYTHLRTFKGYLLHGVDDSSFKDTDGNWFKAGGDGSVFYTLIENADPSKVKAVQEIVYNYNDLNPLNDYKVNGAEQTKNASQIISKRGTVVTLVYSVIVPTMWRCLDLFHIALQKYVNNPLIGEVIIINNDVENTPEWEVIRNSKVKMLTKGINIKVNPAWNLGVLCSKYDLLCIVNDDIDFDEALFEKIKHRITPEAGLHGIITGEEIFNHPQSTDFSISFVDWKPGDNIHGFGQLMFLHKRNWNNIIDGLDIYFGDDFLFHSQLIKGRTNTLIYNIKFESPMAATSKDPQLTAGVRDREYPIWQKWFTENPIIASKPEKVKQQLPNKTILIAVPTNKYIEPETFKAIYDLEVPEGYSTQFQYFYGYQVDQIRNLISHWAINYDYLFAVDSDISFPADTLKKLIQHNVDVVSGLYIQRKPNQHILEIYRNGKNVPYDQIKGKGLVEIDGCGFGCVLVKSHVIKDIGYPQFVYKSAIDHKDTVSEDTYFCLQAKAKGFKIFADTSIKCNHHGSSTFSIDDTIVATVTETPDQVRLRELGNQRLLPQAHVNYLQHLAGEVTPTVVYDIGACVLHWTNEAQRIWPSTKFIAFEAMKESEFLFKEKGIDYNIGLLSSIDNAQVDFYQNTEHPGGNSYYRENVEVNPEATAYFNDSHRRRLMSATLDTVVRSRNFPLPDMIKMDVQGAELDVLRGASYALSQCKDLILELQKVEYNKGAPLKDTVIQYVESLGFKMISGPFCDNGPDGDYHFSKR